MSLPSAFRERLDQMERSRNQRLGLLQSEKELQINKYGILAAKLSEIRLLEQRCLKQDLKIASQHLTLSTLRSEIHRLESLYSEFLQKLRTLKLEEEELKVLEREKDKNYESQGQEMEDFRTQVKNHVDICHVQVVELRCRVNELKLKFSKLQSSLNYSDNAEISAAEKKKAELLAQKDRLDKSLASNYEVREQLTRQLRTILASQDQQRKD